ncbi:MAG: gamma-glutamyl-gamma-aminobutyrate hydrolase family protein [Lachnospiraceae bacterium]|jgi:putative glutamine amidotransferase|nr:gamma-glutamyl-gamma-aminobutyrate hydrolase family protein [Lachnospiraceae bacterium]
MNKPIIGILASSSHMPAGDFGSIWKITLNKAYSDAILNNGGIPLIINPSSDFEVLKPLLDVCSGLLFPGGEDVDPAYFNEDPHPLLGVIRPEIDEFSFVCAKYAFEKHMPILGICRGMQLLNVAKGGSLYQDLSLRPVENILHAQSYNRSYLVHKVDIKEHTLLHKIFNKNTISVNTMHHQAVNKLGEGLIISAVAPDGIAEAIESPCGNILAVQWHPEELTVSAPEMNLLFKHLIEKAKEFNN